MSILPDIPQHHEAIDIMSIAVIVLSALGYLPTVAAGLACIWYLILICDRIMGRKKN